MVSGIQPSEAKQLTIRERQAFFDLLHEIAAKRKG